MSLQHRRRTCNSTHMTTTPGEHPPVYPPVVPGTPSIKVVGPVDLTPNPSRPVIRDSPPDLLLGNFTCHSRHRGQDTDSRYTSSVTESVSLVMTDPDVSCPVRSLRLDSDYETGQFRSPLLSGSSSSTASVGVE